MSLQQIVMEEKDATFLAGLLSQHIELCDQNIEVGYLFVPMQHRQGYIEMNRELKAQYQSVLKAVLNSYGKPRR